MSLHYWTRHADIPDEGARAERLILTHLESVRPEWVEFAMLCAQTLISPDVMLHMLLLLLQDRRIELDNEAPLTEVRVRHA